MQVHCTKLGTASLPGLTPPRATQQMSKGRDVAEYYADVVRNVIVRFNPGAVLAAVLVLLMPLPVASQVKSVDVKKLVYTYLVYHADANVRAA